MNCKQIIEAYLREHGFDGLWCPGECACLLDDLMPCGEGCGSCEPGYRVPCPPECGEHDFHVSAHKEPSDATTKR